MADDHLRRLERAAQAGGNAEREAHVEALRRLGRPNPWISIWTVHGTRYLSLREFGSLVLSPPFDVSPAGKLNAEAFHG